MYSFKYHLVTICAVFLALAVGLLLGAAIGGSGFLNSTTSDLVDSLSSRFSTLSNQNQELDQKYQQYSSLSGSFVNQWQQGKLAGKDVMVVAGATSDQDNISREIAGYVQNAGGNCVVVRVNKESFGTTDQATLQQIQAVLPNASGSYEDSLAQALANEWTRGQKTINVFSGDTLTSSSTLSVSDQTYYPITCTLISSGVITLDGVSSVPDSIDGYVNIYMDEKPQAASTSSADASSGSDGSAAAAESEGSGAVGSAGTSAAGDGSGSGTSDGSENSADSTQSSSTTYSIDYVGASIGSAMHVKKIPVVFTQDITVSAKLMDEASSRGVAGVSSYEGSMGRYSIIALLLSGSDGVYGPDRDQSFWYPQIS